MKNFYNWLHRRTCSSGEKNEPSAGIWHNTVRRNVVDLCLNHKGRLLDVGCGEGLFIVNLAALNPRLEIYALDNDINKLSSAREKCEKKKLSRVKFIHADALDIPAGCGYFDRVICINTFFNVKSIDAVSRILEQISRVCKSKGRIIFDFRNSLNPFLPLKYKLAPYYDATVKENNLPLNAYNPKKIDGILEKLNLKILNRIPVGFPLKTLAPVVIIEAEKC